MELKENELCSFLYRQMQKLENKEITKDDALAHACLARQINSQKRYELERARLAMKIQEGFSGYKNPILEKIVGHRLG